MVRPEPLGSEERREACEEGVFIETKRRGFFEGEPISEEYADDCVKLFTGLPACLRAADTDLDL